jgi:hypothetical protein
MSKLITLEYPITVAGQQIAQVTLRRPKVKDITLARAASPDGGEVEQTLIANLIGLPPDAVAEFDLADYTRVQEGLMGFLPQQTLTTMAASLPQR